MINPGEFNSVLSFVSYNSGADTWTTAVGTANGAVKMVRGMETADADQLQSKVRYRITMPHTYNFTPLAAEHRVNVLHRGTNTSKHMRILMVSDPDFRSGTRQMLCELWETDQ